jgi:hypothetical protein
MNMKMLIFALGLLFMVPSIAAANPTVPDTKGEIKGEQVEKQPCNCNEDRDHHLKHKDWQAKMEQRDKHLMTWVSQYTPEKKAEWEKVMAEKKALRSQWMSPENAEKREKLKKEKMAQIAELKKQFEEGKLTKEEFMKKAHEWKGMGHWKTYHELEMAVEAKNKKDATVLLNQLLVQYKQHNQMLKVILKK